MPDTLPARINPPIIDFPTMVQAIINNPGFDPSVLERVLAMQIAQEDRQGAAALNQAMAAVQAETAPVIRDAVNPHLKTRHATLQAYMDMLQPILRRHEVRVGFDAGGLPGEEPIPVDHVRIRIVIGLGSYSERNSYIDVSTSRAGSRGGAMQMNDQQAVGSAMSYGQRYLLRLKFNLVTAEDDDDGHSAGRDTQGTEGAERQRDQARAGMAGGNGAQGTASGERKQTAAEWLEELRQAASDAPDRAAALAVIEGDRVKAALATLPAESPTIVTLKRLIAGVHAKWPAPAPEPSAGLADLLQRIGAQPDHAGLTALTQHAEFIKILLSLTFAEQDRADAAVKARGAQFDATASATNGTTNGGLREYRNTLAHMVESAGTTNGQTAQ